MIVRISFLVAAFVALLIVNAVAMAGGMPSDEGPSVVIDEDVVLYEQDVETLFTPTITTIIEAELPQYVEASGAEPEAIEIETLAESEIVAPAADTSKRSPAFDCPQYGCGHDL
jgi:hypothetical protein